MCASCGWAVLWRFEGKPQEASPKVLRCARRLLKGILNFVIPWKTSTAAKGLLLIATISAPCLSNVTSLMSPVSPQLELHQLWASSEQKWKIRCVTSKVQKSVGTNTGGNQTMVIPKYRLRYFPRDLFFPKLACYFLHWAPREIRKEQLYTFFANSTLRRTIERRIRSLNQRKQGSRIWLNSTDPEQRANSNQAEDWMDEIPANLIWKRATHSAI